MHTPRTNWFLFGFYTFLTMVVFILGIALPGFRSNRLLAKAPLRDWMTESVLPSILPKPAPVVISVLYSTEKEAWLKEAAASFESSGANLDGHPVKVNLESMGSREIYLSVLDGTRKPDLISPASTLQIAILQDLSTSQFGSPVVNLADQQSCHPVLKTPLVLVAWKERASVLWGDNLGKEMWKHLHDVLIDPKGWGANGHPEWGYVKFGHTDPLKSNSGFMTILLMTYDYLGKTTGLISNDILANQDYQNWFLAFEGTISQFEASTGPLMQKMITYGPSTYDLVAVYEATAIEQADNAVGRNGELHVYYPPATVWSEHPFCIIKANWVTPDKTRAAQLFIDYLTSKQVQETALLKYGFRPVDPSISLNQTGSPFERYTKNGLQSDLSGLPEVEVPPGNVLNTLLEFWSRNVKR